jgi:predicted RNA-binding protein with EMAP domain
MHEFGDSNSLYGARSMKSAKRSQTLLDRRNQQSVTPIRENIVSRNLNQMSQREKGKDTFIMEE